MRRTDWRMAAGGFSENRCTAQRASTLKSRAGYHQPNTRFRQFPFARRTGLTLVELLVVVGLVLFLASFSIGMMRTLLHGQKVSQAATLVQQYLQNAQIRAITNGRPVAVYLDRVGTTGDGATPIAGPVPANYMAARLQLGEVFPPYVGDVLNATGMLKDVGNVQYGPQVTTRPSDSHADEITFASADVASGLSSQGFVKENDFIQIDGCDQYFRIENISSDANGTHVRFFNPPATYNNLRAAKLLNAPTSIDQTYEVSLAMTSPQLALSAPRRSGFRIFRQPTKSMVGAITLPRGTCVDLSLSGFGPSDSGVVLNGALHLDSAPLPSGQPQPSYFSRVGIVFDAQGRMSYVMLENNVGSGLKRSFVAASSKLNLMIGRTEQVLPGFPTTTIQTAAKKNVRDALPLSNLMDPENVWVTSNPFTGDVTTSPVASVTAPIDPDPDEFNPIYVRQARQLATAGARQ